MQWTSITTKSMFGNYSGALFLSLAFEFWKWSTRFISASFTPSPSIHAVNASDPYETCRSHPIGWMATADRDTDEKERCRSGERKRRAKRWKMFLSLKRVHETRQNRFLRWRRCVFRVVANMVSFYRHAIACNEYIKHTKLLLNWMKTVHSVGCV